ncbi:glycosyltransferase [Novosphingobium piscinae]|uniref:Glycosyltransferase n=1 Tax=Novosphingobium piscinae TaxID=1507448 RepID=A0A7X1FY71_9SPHN|nr:glycosyltransferase [Novosphingobium piscinae]MBC2669069.1 glycosyltransferase [Novosphingobium piscinae]
MKIDGVRLNRGVKVRFAGAVLSQIAGTSAGSDRLRIGWYLLADDVHSASARYRCYHFARVLKRDFESHYFTKFAELKAAIPDLDAIVIVKRLDRSVFDVVALARTFERPLFLDLCDDLASIEYPSREEVGLGITALAAAAPALDGITVPSALMAERIEAYLADCGVTGPRCHVIPDIAETRDLYAATETFITGKPSSLLTSANPSPHEIPENVVKRIVWFGNFGAAHSNFGMFSLKSRMKALRQFHATCPLELVIISNSRPVYEALVADCGFPTRYVKWSPSAVYAELERADAALLTTGDDAFCSVKSSNRVIQALATGLPVIADRSEALAEFEEIVFSGSMARCLEACIGPDSAPERAKRQALAARLLTRYAPERLGLIWSELLQAAIGKRVLARSRRSDLTPLLLVSPGDTVADVETAVRALNTSHGSGYRLLVSTEALSKTPALAKPVNRAKALPRFYSGELRGIEALVWRCSAVLLGNRLSNGAKAVADVARRLGREVLDHDAAALLSPVPSAQAKRPPPSTQCPGPNAPHFDPDGSCEWAFVVHSNARGWILDAICQEIGSRQSGSWQVVDHVRPPPPARNVFFSHFSLLEIFDQKYPESLKDSRVFLWYTHPRNETALSIARSLELFARTTRVIFTCEDNRRLWVARGLSVEKTAVVLGAADPLLFAPHQRGNGVVGLSSSFYERKNPDLLLDVVKALPHRQFTLLGRNWNRYARFEELRLQNNFHYTSAGYRDYPRIYSTFDVFLSLSSLEGGPIPLVEAMMCNAIPVASRTGFAPDLIEHGQNGYIFDIDAGAEQVAALIEQAYANPADVRATVERYSWDRFSADIVALAE